MGLPKSVHEFVNSPETTNAQRVKFAVLCSMEVCRGPEFSKWRQWAEIAEVWYAEKKINFNKLIEQAKS